MRFSSTKLENARENLARSQAETSFYVVDVHGLSFRVHPQVFSPKYFRSTHLINSSFPFQQGELFLEIGCGVGVTSVLAALNHDNRVVSGDINPMAVRLTKENAALHGVADRVDAREGDLFSSIEAHEAFDTIFWDLPFVYTPPEHECESLLDRAVCDPGYKSIDLFLEQAPGYLREGGRILASFGSNGEMELLRELARKNELGIRELHRDYIPERGGLTYMLLQLLPDETLARTLLSRRQSRNTS